MQLSWSDPRLSVASDSRRTARYRLLQSWYREQVLNADYGEYRVNGGNRPLGSLLALRDVVERPGLNFLTDDAARYALERADLVQASGGTIDKARLARNMLSEPADGVLDLRRAAGSAEDRGLDVVRAFLDPHAVSVEVMECVWRPAIDVLGDRSGFDAAVITVARGRQPAPHRHRGEVHRAVQPHDLQQRRLPAGARVQRLVPPRHGPAAARPGDQPALAHQPARRRLRPPRGDGRQLGVRGGHVPRRGPGRHPRPGRAERRAARAAGPLPDRQPRVVRRPGCATGSDRRTGGATRSPSATCSRRTSTPSCPTRTSRRSSCDLDGGGAARGRAAAYDGATRPAAPRPRGVRGGLARLQRRRRARPRGRHHRLRALPGRDPGPPAPAAPRRHRGGRAAARRRQLRHLRALRPARSPRPGSRPGPRHGPASAVLPRMCEEPATESRETP